MVEMNTRKILIFSPSELYSGAESLVTLKLMRLLRNNGKEVFLIYRAKKKCASQDDFLQIRPYCKGFSSFLPGKLGSLEWSVRAFLCAWQMHRKIKFDIMVSRIMPIFGHLPALLLHFFTHIPWCANWSDPYPQIIAPFPYGKGKLAKIPLWQRLFCNLLLNSADCHTFPSDRLRGLFLFFFPRLKGKSFVISHVMLDEPDNIGQEDHSILDLVYAGGGLPLRHPEIIVEAVEKLCKIISGDLKLHITFYGEIYLPLMKKIDSSPCKHYFSLYERLPYSQVLGYIRKADLALLLEAPCDIGVFLSSKLLDYLQCGKPVFSISPAVGVMADLIHEFGGGVLADCASPDDIALKLQEIYSDWIAGRLKSSRYDIAKLKEYFSENHVLDQWKIVSCYLTKVFL